MAAPVSLALAFPVCVLCGGSLLLFSCPVWVASSSSCQLLLNVHLPRLAGGHFSQA